MRNETFLGFALGALSCLWLGSKADAQIKIDEIQKAASTTRDMCLSGRQYALEVNSDGSISLSQLGSKGRLRITQNEGTGGALNYSDEGNRLQADKNIITCITTNLPVLLTAMGARLAPPQRPLNCRDPNNGVEGYRTTSDVTRDSGWRGGGYDPTRWCEDVTSMLRGQNPQSQVTVISKDEESKNTCAPFNCPQYLYTCHLKMETDPVFKKSTNPACLNEP